MEEKIEAEARRVKGRGRRNQGEPARRGNRVDDICMDIVDWEANNNMAEIEASVKRIVPEVAEEFKLPLESDKEETLHLRKSRKKKNVDRKYVNCKWLGVVFDDSLDFDILYIGSQVPGQSR